MAEEIKAVKINVSMEDGVIIASQQIDIIDALEDLAKQSENAIDDVLVKIVKAAKDGMDWKGVAKEYL